MSGWSLTRDKQTDRRQRTGHSLPVTRSLGRSLGLGGIRCIDLEFHMREREQTYGAGIHGRGTYSGKDISAGTFVEVPIGHSEHQVRTNSADERMTVVETTEDSAQ
jgi:hypothetical protein